MALFVKCQLEKLVVKVCWFVVFSLCIHQIPGRKVSVKLLHRTRGGISYAGVFKQIQYFSLNTQNSHHLVPENISKAQPTHATIGNSDSIQQTLIWLATTHRTNATIYVPKTQPLPNVTNCLENEVINTAPYYTKHY